MNGLNLFVGNRMEILAERLADILNRPLASPLAPEIIVVQSKGMERWISMQLAAFHGICTNVEFPFPRRMISDIFQAVLPTWDRERVYEPERAAWQIMELLTDCSSRPGFKPLSAYLDNDPQGLKRYQLAGKIAHLFDSYLIFRPEMILDWERGIQKNDEEAWQAELWCLLSVDGKVIHPAALRRTFYEALRPNNPGFADLPERLSLFGISYLPPFYLDIFLKISNYMEVNFFLLNPSREFWFDIRSSREIAREMKRVESGAEKLKGAEELHDENLYLEEGNSLLASLGTLGREFWSFLSDAPSREEELYTESGEETLLAAIQSDILNLRERGKGSASIDGSLEIHACHSPMREVEVLQNSLLAFLEDDPSLQPHDIVVMAPDIETYAPFISAVFDSEGINIPYQIADRAGTAGSPNLEGFLEILKLNLGRLAAAEVLSLLEVTAIRNRFGLTENDLDRISNWVADSGIRWGIDGSSRRREGLPDISTNTWEWGLERLLLGYALPAREGELFADILPYEIGEGGETQLLGVLATFTEKLFSVVESLFADRSLAEWGQVLGNIVERFFAGDEISEPDLPFLRQACLELISLQEKADFKDKISLAVVRSYLEERFRLPARDSGFLSRGVTFCSLLPMRSIPFRVICLLGMNNSDYPRRPQTPGFDLMAGHPRPGDRNRRNDDRYLFLEALLSARSKLYISYVGQSMEDNSRIPPSVVVSELLDYICQGGSENDKPADELIIFHPLQAFNPVCFSGELSRLFSYSQENCRAAEALFSRQSSSLPSDVETEKLPEDPEMEKQVTVRDLIDFFRNPAKYFLKKRLGVILEESDARQEENEPFDLSGLDKYGIGQRLLEKEIATGDMEALYPAIAADGRLPHGSVGHYELSKFSRDIRNFVRQNREILRSERLPAPDIDLEVGGFRITGQLEGLRPSGLVLYRYAAIKARDHLKLWIMHLLLQATSGPEGNGRESLLMGKDGAWTYSPVEKPRKRLGEIIGLYREGLCRPLHFFPESSRAYVESLRKSGGCTDESEEAALDKARKAWEGNYLHGEGADGYYRLCLGNSEPLDEEFRRLSLAVFGPLFEAQRKSNRGGEAS